MKLWDIVKTVGSAALQVALPGTGSLIVGAVNALLPDDKKLPAGATGDDLNSAIASLPPEQQASIMEKDFDVEITQIKESYSTVRAMLESDAKNPHSTRPYVVKGAFLIVAFVIVLTVSVWAFATLNSDATMLIAIAGSWQFVLAMIGPFVTLLWAYFGILKREHKNRLDAANGASLPSGITGVLTSIINRT